MSDVLNWLLGLAEGCAPDTSSGIFVVGRYPFSDHCSSIKKSVSFSIELIFLEPGDSVF